MNFKKKVERFLIFNELFEFDGIWENVNLECKIINKSVNLNKIGL